MIKNLSSIIKFQQKDIILIWTLLTKETLIYLKEEVKYVFVNLNIFFVNDMFLEISIYINT